MPKTKVSSVIEKLKGDTSNYQNFNTPNGLSIGVLLKDGSITDDDMMIDGKRVSPVFILQAAEILRLVAKNAGKVCVFHGLLSGSRFGCDLCRTDVQSEVARGIAAGTSVIEEND